CVRTCSALTFASPVLRGALHQSHAGFQRPKTANAAWVAQRKSLQQPREARLPTSTPPPHGRKGGNPGKQLSAHSNPTISLGFLGVPPDSMFVWLMNVLARLRKLDVNARLPGSAAA